MSKFINQSSLIRVKGKMLGLTLKFGSSRQLKIAPTTPKHLSLLVEPLIERHNLALLTCCYILNLLFFHRYVKVAPCLLHRNQSRLIKLWLYMSLLSAISFATISVRQLINIRSLTSLPYPCQLLNYLIGQILSSSYFSLEFLIPCEVWLYI